MDLPTQQVVFDYIYLSIYLSACLSTYLSGWLDGFLPVCLSVTHTLTHTSIHTGTRVRAHSRTNKFTRRYAHAPLPINRNRRVPTKTSKHPTSVDEGAILMKCGIVRQRSCVPCSRCTDGAFYRIRLQICHAVMLNLLYNC